MEAVVIGMSTIVGKPLAQLLLAAGATVRVCHIDTKDVAAHTRQADLVCVAVGRPGLVTAAMLKPGATVIDAGINRIRGPDGKSKTVGDVAEDAWTVAAVITPVPGGVGTLFDKHGVIGANSRCRGGSWLVVSQLLMLLA